MPDARTAAFFARQSAKFWSFVGRQDRAIACYRRITAACPEDAGAWNALGYLLQAAGDVNGARAALERAVAAAPRDGVARFNLAFALHAAGADEAALAHFERCMALAPSIDRAWYGAGVILNARGEYTRAAPLLAEAARLQPFNPHAGYELARAWHGLGEAEKLRAEYRRVCGFDPQMAAAIARDFALGPS